MAFSVFAKTAFKFSELQKQPRRNLKHVNEIKRSVFSPKLEGKEVRGGVGVSGGKEAAVNGGGRRWPEETFEKFKHTHTRTQMLKND